MDTISQHMWGHQRLFRSQVESGLEHALDEIGFPVTVRAVLVGFSIDGRADHRVCVEPGDGPLSAEDLAGVAARGMALFETDPDSRLRISNPIAHESFHAERFRTRRADALVEAIKSSAAFEELTFFASASTPIAGYDVHSCVGVPTAALDTVHALDNEELNQTHVGRSLQHEVIFRFLRRADDALRFPDPHAALRELGGPLDIVRVAAEAFTRGLAFRIGGGTSNLFDLLNSFTSLVYEQAGAGGRLLVGRGWRDMDSLEVRFRQPISLNNRRLMRKVLELSDDSAAVFVDDRKAYGLGSCGLTDEVVEIVVRGHATWEAHYRGLPRIRVAYGRARLPNPLVDRNRFMDIAARTVGAMDIDRVWEVVQEAQHGGHGTTLVISDDPEREASRLGEQAIRVEPTCLAPGDLRRLGRVDGAVILGPDARSHAFGVILDGDASAGHGDPARGSRFNSAVRYQRTRAPRSMLVVVSDDGVVDLVPDLRPKAHRHEVQQAVDAFCESCDAEPVDGEEFGRTHRRVEELAFYLNESQCQRVNDAHDTEMQRRDAAGEVAIRSAPLRPHPDMDDSYFH